MKMSRLKTWVEGHKDELRIESIRVFWYVLGFGIAWFVNGKLTEYTSIENVLALRDMGLLKFCDPATGMEVTIDKAVEISKKMRK